MAQQKDMRKKLQKVNPLVEELAETIEKALVNSGYRGAIVRTTEDMSVEEKEMAIFDGYLREGYSIEVAAEKAKYFMALLHEFDIKLKRCKPFNSRRRCG